MSTAQGKALARTALAAAATLANDEIAALQVRLLDAQAALVTRMQAADAQIEAIPEGLLDLAPLRPVKVARATSMDAPSVLAQLQSEIDGPEAGIPYLGPGLYPVDALRSLRLSSGQIVIAHPGAVLQGLPHGEDESYLVLGEGISDAMWIGGTLVGDRLDHRYPTYRPLDLRSTHEWNHGFRLRRCSRVTVRDLHVSMCAGDGLSVGGDDLLLERVTSTLNRRQGLTIGGSNRVRVRTSRFTRIGNVTLEDGRVLVGAQRGPNAGIDVEPDTNDVLDLLIEGCLAEANQKPGFLFYAGSTKPVRITATVRGCRSLRNSNQIEAQAETGSEVVLGIFGNTLQRRPNSGVGIKLLPNVRATIGAVDSNGADKNTFLGPSDRADFTRQGTGSNTSSDIQKNTAATATVLWNDYR